MRCKPTSRNTFCRPFFVEELLTFACAVRGGVCGGSGTRARRGGVRALVGATWEPGHGGGAGREQGESEKAAHEMPRRVEGGGAGPYIKIRWRQPDGNGHPVFNYQIKVIDVLTS